MTNITIGQVAEGLAFLVAIIGSIEYLLVRLKKWLRSELNDEKMQRCKYDLVSIMSRIRNGYIPTAEEKIILSETKDIYNKLGGDGYIDGMYEELKKGGLI